jgi:phage terminase small subunit
MSKLTPKQKKFCDEYLIDLNATQAAIRTGYSEKTAQQASSRLLLNVVIKEYIESKQKKTSEKLEITKEVVLEMVFKIAKAELEKTGDRLKAFEIINKMLGLNDVEKHEVQQTMINWIEEKSYDKE